MIASSNKKGFHITININFTKSITWFLQDIKN